MGRSQINENEGRPVTLRFDATKNFQGDVSAERGRDAALRRPRAVQARNEGWLRASRSARCTRAWTSQRDVPTRSKTLYTYRGIPDLEGLAMPMQIDVRLQGVFKNGSRRREEAD